MAPRALALLAVAGARYGYNPGMDPRRDLPGMRRDAFDDLMSTGGGGGGQKQKVDLDPVCPEGDGTAAFDAVTIVSQEIFFRPPAGGECVKLVEIGGANVSSLVKTARAECGRGWKGKLVDAMSVIFEKAGLETWPVGGEHANTVNVTYLDTQNVTQTYVATVSTESQVAATACWQRGCDCAQSKDPVMRVVLTVCGLLMGGGLVYDAGRLAYNERNEKKRKEEKRKRKEERRRLKEEAKAAAGEGETAEAAEGEAKEGAKEGETAAAPAGDAAKAPAADGAAQ